MKMRTRTKIATSIIAMILSCVIIFTVAAVNTNTGKTVNADAKVRTVELSNDYFDDQSIFDEFDEHELQTDENGFELVAKKTFDSSLFSEMDLVGLSDAEEDVTVRYEVQYIDADDAVLLTMIIEGTDEVPVIETVPGLVTHNIAGEPDIMLVIDGEKIWISELYPEGVIDEVGLFSWLKKAAKKVSEALTKAAVTLFRPFVRLGADISVAILGRGAADIGAAILNMSPELDSNGNRNGIYHADFDCWQAKFGYNNMFDIIFDAATSMRSRKFDFDVTNDGVTDYILWAWKGDYLNLGAGAELGIYARWRYGEDIWKVDKSLAMNMTLQLEHYGKTIIDWKPSKEQWWITGFNFNYQHVNRDSLCATYTVTFDNLTMYNYFTKANSDFGWGWESEGGKKLSYSF